MDKYKQIKKIFKFPLEKLTQDSNLLKRGLKDLSILSRIDELFKKLKEKYEEGIDNHNENDEFQECIKLCHRILGIDPNHFLTLCYYGSCLFNLEKYEESISIFNKALEISPKQDMLYFYNGLISYYLGNYDKAIEFYTKKIELNPDCINAYKARGLAYYRIGDYNKSFFDYDKVFKKDKYKVKEIALFTGNIESCVQGYDYYFKGKYNEAISEYNKVLERDEYDWVLEWVYNNRGVCYCELGKFEESISDYNRALEILLDSCVYYNRAIVYYKKGEFDKFIADYSSYLEDELSAKNWISFDMENSLFLEIDIRDINGMVANCKYLGMQGKIAEAIEQYKKILNSFNLTSKEKDYINKEIFKLSKKINY